MNDFDRRIARIAGRQHGALSRDQALAAGVSVNALKWRLRTGSLEPIHAGVYRLVGTPRTWHQDLIAATLARHGSVVSHLPGAALWALPGAPRKGVELSVSRDLGRCVDVRVHRVELPPVDVTLLGGIPVTTVARTLIDIAPLVEPATLSAIFDNAARRKLVSVPRLRDRSEDLGGRGRAGSAAIRDLLRAREQGLVPFNEFEFKLLQVLRTRRLPRPRSQYRVALGDGSTAYVD
ncbi:MAG: type IV toxin-antitoxin system AbiEi family antitoxin domain-containing protein, partial [Actinobacteria bacterium]|nr:type IV toxin-antitoxin system AbiEi family antitoxin domain-containing protein [Actinomycetota bacterium]